MLIECSCITYFAFLPYCPNVHTATLQGVYLFVCASDDLKSTVSDTWSTDVLASDSEPPEMNQQVRLEEIAEEMVRQHLLATQEVGICTLFFVVFCVFLTIFNEGAYFDINFNLPIDPQFI